MHSKLIKLVGKAMEEYNNKRSKIDIKKRKKKTTTKKQTKILSPFFSQKKKSILKKHSSNFIQIN